MIQEGRTPQGNAFGGTGYNPEAYVDPQANPTEFGQIPSVQTNFSQPQQVQQNQGAWAPMASASNSGSFAPVNTLGSSGNFAQVQPMQVQQMQPMQAQQMQQPMQPMQPMQAQPMQQPMQPMQAQPMQQQSAQTGFMPMVQQDMQQPVYPQSSAQVTATQFAPQQAQQPQQPVEEPIDSRPQNIPAGTAPAIVFDHVTKIYDAQPDRPALDDISLQVYPGEFVFLVGHSGSGKSTFIRLINRELQVTSGNLWVAGENLSDMRNWRIPYLRRNIGCVFQDFKLLPKKTAFENVAFALEVIGKSKHIIKTQVPEVLRLVGLEDAMDKMPDQLSGGEQQRVSIARAIVNRPPLLICDEPTGNLDPQTSLGIMRLLDRINRTGTIVLVATHDKEMVNSLRRRVITLENGHLVRDQDKGVYGLDA